MKQSKYYAQILLWIAFLTGIVSAYKTLGFTWDASFQAPALSEGATHSNYHVFREALMAIGFNLTLLWLIFKTKILGLVSWKLIMFTACFYYAGWWLAWPIWGYHAPSVTAETVHAIATICGLAGLWMVKPRRNEPDAVYQ